MTFFNPAKITKLAKLAIISLALTFSAPSFAQPVLKSSVKLSSAIVTVGDMFDNAGLNAERALFRAPAPGTTGSVGIQSIRIASLKAGITNFETKGLSSVSVERTGSYIDEEQLVNLVINDLTSKGILSGGVFSEPKFISQFSPFYTISSYNPVELTELRYAPTSGNFTAIFKFAGETAPREIRGRANLMIKTPHLKDSLNSGAIITPKNIEMRTVSVNMARNAGFSTMEQIIGMQLVRPTRAGMMLRPSDVIKPEIIKRSSMVTIYYKNGPLTLTANGQALNSAAKGEMVSVLNTKSKQIIQGVATKSGAVEINISNAKIL